MFENNNVILLTGISGQLGQALCRYIYNKNQNNLIVGITRCKDSRAVRDMGKLYKNLIIAEGSLADKTFLEGLVCLHNPNVVGHLSAQSSVAESFLDPFDTYQVNVVETINLLEACNKLKEVKLFNMSSIEIFGNECCPILNSRNEDTPINPTNAYGASKAAAHIIVRSQRLSNFKSYFNFICSNFISEFQDSRFVTSKIINHAITETIDKLELGNIDAIRDWVYIDDLISAIDIALNGPPEDYCVASGNTYTVKEFGQKVYSSLNKSFDKNVTICSKLFRVGDTNFSNICTKKIRSTGWTPRYNVDELIKKIILEKTKNE